MTHLAYVVPSYALAVLVPGVLGLGAAARLRAARRRLRALDPRVPDSRAPGSRTGARARP